MNKYFFASEDLLSRYLMISFICWLFLTGKVFLLMSLVAAVFVILFRKKKIDYQEKASLDENIISSPITGRFLGEKNGDEYKELSFLVFPWNNYGLHMPINGEFFAYAHNDGLLQISIRNNKDKILKLKFKTAGDFKKARVFTRSGDNGQLGAIMGYLPFGGKVVIQLPKSCDILIKKGDNVHSYQTLLGSFKDE